MNTSRNPFLIMGGGILVFIIIKSILPYDTADWFTYLLFFIIAFICYRLIKGKKRNFILPFDKPLNPTPPVVSPNISPVQQLSKASTPFDKPSNPIPPVVSPSILPIQQPNKASTPFEEMYKQKYQAKNNDYIKFIVIGAVLAVLVAHVFFGAVSVYFFSVADNLNLAFLWSPFIIWGILGLFAGATYGGFIAFRKYKLKLIHVLAPALVSVFVVICLFVNNSFFKGHVRPNTVVIDSTKKADTVTIAPVVKRHKRKKRKHITSSIDTNKTPGSNSSTLLSDSTK
jgi:hypothetical protein